MNKLSLCLASAALLSATAAIAAETITYTYDAKGRLTQVAHSGSVNNGITTTYSHDSADNRKNVTTTTGGTGGSSGGGGSGGGGGTATITALNPSLTFSASSSNAISLATLANTNGASGLISAFSVPSGDGSAPIAGGQSVTYTAAAVAQAPACNPANTISFSVPYTVQNIASGQTTSGSASITVKGTVAKGVCQ